MVGTWGPPSQIRNMNGLVIMGSPVKVGVPLFKDVLLGSGTGLP